MAWPRAASTGREATEGTIGGKEGATRQAQRMWKKGNEAATRGANKAQRSGKSRQARAQIIEAVTTHQKKSSEVDCGRPPPRLLLHSVPSSKTFPSSSHPNFVPILPLIAREKGDCAVSLSFFFPSSIKTSKKRSKSIRKFYFPPSATLRSALIVPPLIHHPLGTTLQHRFCSLTPLYLTINFHR